MLDEELPTKASGQLSAMALPEFVELVMAE